MKIGNREFDLKNHCYVMGILNVTPDSFSDGGSWNQMDKALAHAEQMIEDGADIIDLGGESTHPGYTMISDQEEIDRVCPVLEALKQRFDIPISLDTYKGKVAEAAMQAGGFDLFNDIWGLKYDRSLGELAAKTQKPIILMHNRKDMNYGDFYEDVLNELKESIELARACGIPDDQIILDPGIGFAKDIRYNLPMLNHMEILNSLGFPWLLGASRKKTLGQVVDLPVSDLVEATMVTSVFAVIKGASFVRVHDVKENKRAVVMAEGILKAEV